MSSIKCERCQQELNEGMRCSNCGHRTVLEQDREMLLEYLKKAKEVKEKLDEKTRKHEA